MVSFSVWPSSLPKGRLYGNHPTTTWDYFYLEPVAIFGFSPVAQLQLWSRKARKHAKQNTEYWLWGKKPTLAISRKVILLIPAIYLPTQLERKLFSACHCLAHSQLLSKSRFITERQHLCLQSCFCRMSKMGRWWFLSLVPLCCLWHVQPSQLLLALFTWPLAPVPIRQN